MFLRRRSISDIQCVEDVVAVPVVPISYENLTVGIFKYDGSPCLPALHSNWTGSSCQFGDMPGDINRSGLPILPPGIYGGLFFDHFGHFIVESIGRLWAHNISQTAETRLPIYVFEPWNKISLQDERHFAVQILRLLGVDVGRIVKIKEPARISNLLVPLQKYGAHLLANPSEDFVDFLFRAQQAIEREAPNEGLRPRNVYVSRSLLDPSYGKVAGEQEFERFLARSGYHIFHPQEHPVSEQLQVYAHAEKLIFCEGSAVHACILLPRISAQIAVILRRKGTGTTLQFLGFGKEISALECVVNERSFGLPTWNGVTTVDYGECSRLLCDKGFVDNTFDEWRDIVEYQEREAVAAYASAVVQDQRFLTFLQEADSLQARARAAETKLAAAQADLSAVRTSRSWRLTEPLRRAKDALAQWL